MRNAARIFLALLVMLPLAQLASAGGYGTSAISFTKASVSLAPGGSTTVGYNITIATGNTWGTTINIVNQAQLSAAGITVSLSNAGGPDSDPPWSGTMTITAASGAASGSYSVILNATGDDPTTSDATLSLAVASSSSSSTTSTPASSTTAVSSTTSPTTAPSTSSAPYISSGTGSSGSSSAYGSSGASMLAWETVIAVVVILIGLAVAVMKTKSPGAKLTELGVALILLGTAIWLYGDFSGGNFTYIYAGVLGLVLGTLVWLYGDRAMLKKPLIALGLILLVIGILLWLYSDFVSFSFTYLWAGVGLILLGTIVWIIGDLR